MCIRLMSMVFGNIYIAALVLNLILSYLFIHLFYAYARHYLPRPEALKSIILLLSFPPAFWLSAIYTEALFLFSLFGFIYFYQVEKSYKSVLFAAMIPLIRGQAFFCSGGGWSVHAVAMVSGQEGGRAIQFPIRTGQYSGFCRRWCRLLLVLLLYNGFFFYGYRGAKSLGRTRKQPGESHQSGTLSGICFLCHSGTFSVQ